jgi:hypothetical protein
MIDTTMIVRNNNQRHQKPPAAMTNNHFPAINTSFSYFLKSLGRHDLFTLNGVQNKPNLNISIFAICTFVLETYLPLDTWYRGKNKPKANPNKANSNPIQTQFQDRLKAPAESIKKLFDK